MLLFWSFCNKENQNLGFCWTMLNNNKKNNMTNLIQFINNKLKPSYDFFTSECNCSICFI